MKILQIDTKAKITEADLTRKQLIDEFQLHIRDLRPVVSLKQVVTFFRRGKCIVLNFRSVKMIIGAQKIYVFNIENPNIRDLLVAQLEKAIKVRDRSHRFEFLGLEQALLYFVAKIERQFQEIEVSAHKTFERLNKELKDETFEQLLSLKKLLSKLQIDIQELEDAIEEVLEDEEEMTGLCLISQAQAHKEEIESILENSLEQVEDLSHKIDELEENIDDSQEILTLKLSNLRNTIIKVDLIVSVSTGILALLAVVTGLYGMNVTNHLERSNMAFYLLTGGIFLTFVLLSAAVLVYLKRKKVL